jgi:hypothetical protein
MRALAAFGLTASVGIVVGVLGSDLIRAHASQQNATEPKARTFVADAGMVLNFVKPDKQTDFEAVMAKVKEALQKSDKPDRQAQAETWRLFKAEEAGANGAALYVFWINPAVKGADYTVSTILAEGFPNEVQELFKQYADAYSQGQNFVNLRLVSKLGE